MMKETFRGIKMRLRDVNALRAMPDELKGENPKDFRLDRWLPISLSDKKATNELSERWAEWVPVIDYRVYYGLERWGEMIPENYTEYYAVIVLRPWHMSPKTAIHLCSDRNFSGPSQLIIP